MLKKCKQCGNEFNAYNTIQNKCFSCQALYGYGLKKSKQKAILPKVITNKPKKVKKPKSDNKKWKDKAWKQFSKYIRYRDCLSETQTMEMGKCYTCGKELPFKGLQAGHCISGRGNFILLDEDWVKAQCLAAGHFIHTIKGKVDIKFIKIGDELIAFNEKTHKKEQSIVENIEKIIPKKLYLITLENGQKIKATPDHRILTDNGWKYIYELLQQPDLCNIISE